MKHAVLLVLSMTVVAPLSNAATVAIDWLEFDNIDGRWWGHDDNAIMRASTTLNVISGEVVPGFPRGNVLGNDYWSDLPYSDSQQHNQTVSTLRLQVAPQSESVSYNIVVTSLQPRSTMVLGIGQLFGSGNTSRELLLSVSAGDEIQYLKSAQWDSGIERFGETLTWNDSLSSLRYDSDETGNSEFAFFQVTAAPMAPELRIFIHDPTGLPFGSGDVIEIAVGYVVPEPSVPSLIFLCGLSVLMCRWRSSIN